MLEWLDSIRAEVVHVHSLEGYGLDLIAAIRRRATGRGHAAQLLVCVPAG